MLDLKPLPKESLPFYPALYFFKYVKGDKELILPQSESFLLWEYMRKGKLTDKKFQNHLALEFESNNIWFPPSGDWIASDKRKETEKQLNQIITDGRYYTFSLQNNEPLTIDLGFNFFNRHYQFSNLKEKKNFTE